LLAGNGVIHSVDAVLTPSGVGSTIAIDGLDESFSILKAALAATGLDTVLDGDGPFTLFAPNDDAFLAAFTEEELAELLADDADQASDLAALEGILVYDVVGDLVLSTDLDPGVNMVQSISLADIDVTVIGDDVTVESANAIGFDILAANGVIHVVDAVLVP
jgi:transforming growth factor-beta-induced protein